MDLLFSKLDTRQTAQETDATPTSTTSTDGLVGELIWKNSLQQRTTTVVTISFNVLAALLVIASIFLDARKAWKRGLALRASYGLAHLLQRSANSPRKKSEFLSNIHPAATFPLIISTAIAAQGIIFLGAQGTGLNGLRSDQCRVMSQIVWPGLFHFTAERN